MTSFEDRAAAECAHVWTPGDDGYCICHKCGMTRPEQEPTEAQVKAVAEALYAAMNEKFDLGHMARVALLAAKEVDHE